MGKDAGERQMLMQNIKTEGRNAAGAQSAGFGSGPCQLKVSAVQSPNPTT